MGLLKKKNNSSNEPKPPAPPKPLALMPEEKAAYAGAVRRYKDSFQGEGFHYFPQESYDPRFLMSSRWSEYDPRKVHVLDLPMIGVVSDIAVGATDSRIYATWVFHVPVVRNTVIYDTLTQVAGIFLDSNAPTSFSDSDPSGFWEFEPLRTTVANAPSSHGVRIQHGWLLSDFLTVVPDINIAVAEWKYLDAIIEDLDTDGFNFGAGRDTVSLLRSVFPSMG